MQEIPRRKTVTVDPMRPTTIRVSDIKKMIRSLVASVMICAASAFQAPMVKHARFSQFWLSIRQPPEYVQVFDFLIGWRRCPLFDLRMLPLVVRFREHPLLSFLEANSAERCSCVVEMLVKFLIS